jgi:D-citramalate synthase
LRPSTTLCLKIDGEVIEEHAQGDGQFDVMNALAKNI